MPENQPNSDELEKLRKEIERWPELALDAAEAGMVQAVLYLHGRIPEYPEAPTPSPDGVSYLNDAQRRWFFAAVRAGKIKGWQWIEGHPAKTGLTRTATLGRKFTEVVKGQDSREGWAPSLTRDQGEVVGHLGTNVPYAPWVVGPSYPGEQINGKTMYQARIHQGRWFQFYVVMEGNMDGAWQDFSETFWPAFMAKIGEQK